VEMKEEAFKSHKHPYATNNRYEKQWWQQHPIT
jgi:hypothetical protein